MYGNEVGYAAMAAANVPASPATSSALRNASQLQQVLIQEQNENKTLRYKLQCAREEISLHELLDSLMHNKSMMQTTLSSQEAHSYMISIMLELKQVLQPITSVFCVLKYPGEYTHNKGWAICSEQLRNIEPLHMQQYGTPRLNVENAVDVGVFEVSPDSALYNSLATSDLRMEPTSLAKLLCIPVDPGTGEEATIFWFFECMNNDINPILFDRLRALMVSQRLSSSSSTTTSVSGAVTTSILDAVSSEILRVVTEQVTRQRYSIASSVRSCASNINLLLSSEAMISNNADLRNIWTALTRETMYLPSLLQNFVNQNDEFSVSGSNSGNAGNNNQGIRVKSCDLYVASLTGGFLQNSSLETFLLNDKTCGDLFDFNKATLLEAISSSSPIVYHDKSNRFYDMCNGMVLFMLFVKEGTGMNNADVGPDIDYDEFTSHTTGGNDLVYASFLVYRFEGILSDFSVVPLQRDIITLLGPNIKRFIDDHLTDIFDPLSCPTISSSSSFIHKKMIHAKSSAVASQSLSMLLHKLVQYGNWRALEGTNTGLPILISSVFESTWSRVFFVLRDRKSAIVLDQGRKNVVVDLKKTSGDLKEALSLLLSTHGASSEDVIASAEKMVIVNDMDNLSSGIFDLLGIVTGERLVFPKRSHVCAFNLYTHHHKDENQGGDLIVLCGRSWKSYDAEVTEIIAEAMSNATHTLMKNAIPVQGETYQCLEENVKVVSKHRVKSIIGFSFASGNKDKLNWAFRMWREMTHLSIKMEHREYIHEMVRVRVKDSLMKWMMNTHRDRLVWAFSTWRGTTFAIHKDEKRQEISLHKELHATAQTSVDFQYRVLEQIMKSAVELGVMEEVALAMNQGAAEKISELNGHPVAINSLIACNIENGGGIIGNDVMRQALISGKHFVVERAQDVISYNPIMHGDKFHPGETRLLQSQSDHDSKQADVVLEYDETGVNGHERDGRVQAIKDLLQNGYLIMVEHQHSLQKLSHRETGGASTNWPLLMPSQHIARLLEKRDLIPTNNEMSLEPVLENLSTQCGRALSSSSRCINAAVLYVQRNEISTTESGNNYNAAAISPCVFHWLDGLVIENNGGSITVPLTLLQKLTHDGSANPILSTKQSHCRSILTTPGPSEEENLFYIGVTKCKSTLEHVDLYLVLESKFPLNRRQLEALESFATIASAEMDVIRMKVENAINVEEMIKFELEVSNLEFQKANMKWLLEYNGLTSQMQTHHSTYLDGTAFLPDVFWNENEKYEDDGDLRKSMEENRPLTLGDMSHHVFHLLRATCSEITSTVIFDISRDNIRSDDRNVNLKSKNVSNNSYTDDNNGGNSTEDGENESQMDTEYNSLDTLRKGMHVARTNPYCLLSIRDNCVVVVTSENDKSNEAQLYVPVGQLAKSKNGETGGDAFVLEVVFSSANSLHNYLMGKDKESHSQIVDSCWSPHLPIPHSKTLPVIRIDKSSSLLTSKKLEEASLGINMVLQATLSIRKTIEIQHMHASTKYLGHSATCSKTINDLVEVTRKLLLNLLADDFILNLSVVSIVLYVAMCLLAGTDKDGHMTDRDRVRLHWSTRKDFAPTWCIGSPSVMQQCFEITKLGLDLEVTYQRIRALLLPYLSAVEVNDRDPLRASSPIPPEVLETAASNSAVTELDVSVHRSGVNKKISTSSHTSSVWLPLQLGKVVGSEASDGLQLLEISTNLLKSLFPTMEVEICASELTNRLNDAFMHSAWAGFGLKMLDLRQSHQIVNNLELLIEAMTSVLAEVCSDTSTNKTIKLITNIVGIIKRIPGVFDVRVEVKNREGEATVHGAEVLYASATPVDVMDEDCLIYPLDCYEITGNLAVYSDKYNRKKENKTEGKNVFAAAEVKVMQTISTTVARRLYELTRGHKNKLAAGQAIDELKSKKTKFQELQDKLSQVESARSIMANEIEILRKETTDLRAMLKQEQATSTEAARRLQFARETSEKSLDDIARELKIKEATHAKETKDLKANMADLKERLKLEKDKNLVLSKDKENLAARVIEADENAKVVATDMMKLKESFEQEQIQSEATIKDLQNTIEQKLKSVIDHNIDDAKNKNDLTKSLERAETDLYISKETNTKLAAELAVSEQAKTALESELSDTQAELSRAEALLRAAMAKIELLEGKAEDSKRRSELFRRIADEQLHLNKNSMKTGSEVHHPLSNQVSHQRKPFAVRHVDDRSTMSNSPGSVSPSNRRSSTSRHHHYSFSSSISSTR